MTNDEIKHFKSILRESSLRHMNILLDDKFQKELLTIIKDYEQLQQENKKQKEVIDKTKDYLNNNICYVGEKITIKPYTDLKDLSDILKEVE